MNQKQIAKALGATRVVTLNSLTDVVSLITSGDKLYQLLNKKNKKKKKKT